MNSGKEDRNKTNNLRKSKSLDFKELIDIQESTN